MIVGVLSDTHLSGRSRGLPRTMMTAFREVDVILHAGDWVTLDVYEELSKLAPVYGVAGNGDPEAIVQRFGLKTTVECGGVRIGLVHGHTGPGKTTPERAIRAFADDKPDLIVFGHSHIPLLEKSGQTVLFNPGSPTAKRRQPAYSYGLVTINGTAFEAKHVFFADPL
ncbi:metallophosphoesterase family protein [Paenibacillus ginsengarvi]|uniref:Phosphoesterase n=1 Tax=Paenibacillus ginsengarvi TaxID=400777 RepID=A0A3B0CL68_9BACL|nr:metallophosphoesterase family protein [Paenibacillus ginsengarvi]RKN86425.1 metallophosphoesterase [Paenibacillus ginsengarvi]